MERILSKPDLLKKTIFVVGDGGEAPVLSPFQGMTSLAGVHTISEGEVRLLGNREYLSKTIEGWRW